MIRPFGTVLGNKSGTDSAANSSRAPASKPSEPSPTMPSLPRSEPEFIPGDGTIATASSPPSLAPISTHGASPGLDEPIWEWHHSDYLWVVIMVVELFCFLLAFGVFFRPRVYEGLTLDRGKWKAQLVYNGKQCFLFRHENKDIAQNFYDYAKEIVSFETAIDIVALRTRVRALLQ
jgi:hypothetical protein